MNRQPKRLFEFERFRIDAGDKVLSRDGVPLQVTPKAFEILLTLVENHGRTVGKDELIDRVWADTFVEVGNLNRNISTLRSLLGDDSHHPIFIRTLPKRGYRFDADVREVIEDEEELIVERRTNYRIAFKESAKTTEAASTRTFRRPRAVWLGAAIIAVGLMSALAFSGYLGGGTADWATSTDARAAELYNEGRTLWQDRTGESLHRATILLEQAVEAAPDMAIAHAALADAYAFDVQHRTKVESTARRAIELDATRGEPYATLGFLNMFWEWKFDEADSHFKRAISLSPNYATAHQWYAISLMAMGQGNEAQAEIATALDLEPDSLAINTDACRVLYFLKRFDEAEARCRRALEIAPRSIGANQHLYDIFSESGQHNKAVEQFFHLEEIVQHYTADRNALVELRKAYSRDDIRAYWQKRVEMLKRRPVSDFAMARYYARLGNVEKTFEHLQRAYEIRDLDFLNYLSEPVFVTCCFADPRYNSFPPFASKK